MRNLGCNLERSDKIWQLQGKIVHIKRDLQEALRHQGSTSTTKSHQKRFKMKAVGLSSSNQTRSKTLFMTEQIQARARGILNNDQDLQFLSDLKNYLLIMLLRLKMSSSMYMASFKNPQLVSQSSPHLAQGTFSENSITLIRVHKRKIKASLD